MESYGIAAFREVKTGGIELLMIRKRSSYAFARIAAGQYSRKKTSIIKLLSKTTFYEKTILQTLNFHLIYFIAFAKEYSKLSYAESKWFERNERFFQNTFTQRFIEDCIYGTASIDLVWEFPKGRLAKESAESCAVREFTEETGISDPQIIDMPPVIFDFSDDQDAFRYTIYAAKLDNVNINQYRKHCYTEISAMRWVDGRTAKNLLDRNTQNLFGILIKKIKNWRKRHLKNL